MNTNKLGMFLLKDVLEVAETKQPLPGWEVGVQFENGDILTLGNNILDQLPQDRIISLCLEKKEALLGFNTARFIGCWDGLTETGYINPDYVVKSVILYEE